MLNGERREVGDRGARVYNVPISVDTLKSGGPLSLDRPSRLTLKSKHPPAFPSPYNVHPLQMYPVFWTGPTEFCPGPVFFRHIHRPYGILRSRTIGGIS